MVVGSSWNMAARAEDSFEYQGDYGAAAEQTLCGKRMKRAALCGLVLGLILVAVSLVVGVVGFILATSDCTSNKGDCTQPSLALRARKYRVAFAAGFTVGTIISILSVVFYHRSFRFAPRQTSGVLVSTVTQCGQLKTPTPTFMRRLNLPAVVDPVDVEIEADSRQNDATLHACDTTENRNVQATRALSCEMCRNPPPSYEEALELVSLQQQD